MCSSLQYIKLFFYGRVFTREYECQRFFFQNFLNDIYIKKYITNEDNNIIRVRSTSIILFIFMSDIFFCICLLRDVLLLLSTILYDLWVK